MFSALYCTGGYFNPILATVLKWGCHGQTYFEHIFVYWIGECTGAVLSLYIFKMPLIRTVLLYPEMPKKRRRPKKKKTKLR